MTLEDLPRGLPKRWATFLLKLSIAPSLDRLDYQALNAVSHTTAKHDLAELRAAGLIVRSGRGRGTRYSVNIPFSGQPQVNAPSTSGQDPASFRTVFGQIEHIYRGTLPTP